MGTLKLQDRNDTVPENEGLNWGRRKMQRPEFVD